MNRKISDFDLFLFNEGKLEGGLPALRRPHRRRRIRRRFKASSSPSMRRTPASYPSSAISINGIRARMSWRKSTSSASGGFTFPEWANGRSTNTASSPPTDRPSSRPTLTHSLAIFDPRLPAKVYDIEGYVWNDHDYLRQTPRRRSSPTNRSRFTRSISARG
ncbi:MAG: hypothetical protein MZU97_19330 [Bacillus subtilis]|nr:hypothetical protein [Bacillus subtilis]